MKTTRISIDVVDNRIVCRAGGGNLRGHKDDRVIWESKHTFSLRFAILTGAGESNWPFQGAPKPANNVQDFDGTLALTDKENPPAYKYTVFIEGLVPLDPIIIVDKD